MDTWLPDKIIRTKIELACDKAKLPTAERQEILRLAELAALRAGHLVVQAHLSSSTEASARAMIELLVDFPPNRGKEGMEACAQELERRAGCDVWRKHSEEFYKLGAEDDDPWLTASKMSSAAVCHESTKVHQQLDAIDKKHPNLAGVLDCLREAAENGRSWSDVAEELADLAALPDKRKLACPEEGVPAPKKRKP